MRSLADHIKTTPVLLSIREVADLLQVCDRTVAKMIADGRIPHIRVGWQYRIDRAEVLRSLQPKPTETGDK